MELRSYFRIVHDKWWIVLAGLISTIVATAVFTFTQTPTYQATATYIVAPTGGYETVEGLVDVLDAMSRRAEIAGTYVSVVASREIKRQAAGGLRLSETQRDALTVESRLVPDTNVIEITVEGSDPQLVKVFADAVGASAGTYVQQLYEPYGLTILDPALVPTSPVRPRTAVNLALGMGLGLVLGAGLAFLFDYVDTTLRTSQEIEATVNLPTFAQIPVARRRRKESAHSLNGDPRQAEAFLRLRTRILAEDQDTPLQMLLVTSAGPGEGKSTVVAHLAVAMARSGRTVVAVDADLRRSTLHEFFDLGNQEGLSDILKERASLEQMVQTTQVPGLRLLPSGRVSPAPVVDLLDSPRMEALLQQLRGEYDLVLLDTPAWLSVTDAAVLAPMADAVLLVVGCAQTTEAALLAVRQQLSDVKARVAGVVVNRVHRDGSYYYKYYAQPEPLHSRDPLTKISGIGPAYERALNELGIVTFRQLAKQKSEDLARAIGPERGAGRSRCKEWIEQARKSVGRERQDRPISRRDAAEQAERPPVPLFGTVWRTVRRLVAEWGWRGRQ